MRTVKYMWPLIACLILCMTLLCGCALIQKDYQSYEMYSMDTIMSWKVWDASDSSIHEDLKSIILEAEQMLSVTNQNSEASNMNRESGTPFEASDALAGIIKRSLTFAEETDGALNVALYPILRAWGFTTENYSVPGQEYLQELLPYTDWTRIQVEGNLVTMQDGMALDFGAVGKGYVTDVCVDLLKEKGITSARLDLGGNIYTLGTKKDGTLWNIGVKMPFETNNELAGILKIQDTAVVTSGNYQRYFEQDGKLYHHIFDSKTGYPADNGLYSVTILSQDAFEADALSTAYFVMGQEAAEEDWRQRGGIEVIWITSDYKIYYTEGLKDCFTVTEGLDSEMVIR